MQSPTLHAPVTFGFGSEHADRALPRTAAVAAMGDAVALLAQIAQMQAAMQAQALQTQHHVQQMQAAHAQELLAAQAAVVAAGAAGAAAAAAPPRGPPMRIPPPSTYDGKTSPLDEWLAAMLQQFAYYETNTHAERIRHAAVLLRGAALDWWQAFDALTPAPVDWDDMVALLKARFQPVDRADDARAKLVRLRQGKHSAAEYTSSFRRLLQSVPDMSEGDKLFQYKNGLSDAIATQLNVHGVATLAAAIAMAVRVGALSVAASAASAHSAMDLGNVEGGDMETGASGDAPVTRAELDLLLAAMYRRGDRGARAPPGGTAGRPRDRERTLPRIAHLSEKQVGEYMDANMCFGCKSLEHRSRACPLRVVKDGKPSWTQQ